MGYFTCIKNLFTYPIKFTAVSLPDDIDDKNFTYISRWASGGPGTWVGS